jgi:hypothetical protein
MRKHVTADVLSRLMHRELTDEEMIAALRHLDRCDDCAAMAQEQVEHELAELPHAIGLDSVEPEPHLDRETQVIPYVAGRLGPAEREIADSHLDDCAQCREAVDAQRALRKRERSVVWYAVAAVAAAAVFLTLIARVDRAPVVLPTAATIPVVNVPQQQPVPETRASRNESRTANAEWDALVKNALATGRLPFPDDLDELRGVEDTLRGEGAPATSRVGPAGVVIDDTRPELSWPAIDGATYVVSIFDGEEEVVRSKSLDANRWTPSRDLPRGRTLVWQVAAEHEGTLTILPSPPAPQAMFRIISARDHRELSEAKAKHPDDHALLAVLYARSGMEKEALREWEKGRSE